MRKKLVKAVVIISLIGIGFIIYVLLSSLDVNNRTKNNATITVSVSGMTVGEVRKVEGHYFLYKKAEQVFVLMDGWAPYKGCGITYFKSGENGHLFQSQYQDKPHFYDPCDGSLWNLEGIHVQGGTPLEKDMVRRKFKLIDNDYILFDRSQS